MNPDKIYKTFDRVTSRIRSHAIMSGAEPVGFVLIHYPADGAGRLKAFLHLYGLPMAYGSAAGYGYDKASAAVYAAIISMQVDDREIDEVGIQGMEARRIARLLQDAFSDGGRDYVRQMEDQGLTLARGC